ncbi:hypothetical protein [Anaerotalea alkaliphila]|uniref:Uncharacterized protein n=1 Tax=Anaerotalea alkaliphila TaxID=2662126 RepID=A0A7X5HXQ8_9FIRM|nr:hypothetical protein [Anaerotalea alkaliphila]NDL68592.1 hypothetical protein [Anaerotalea alkaliphila]
MIDEKMCFAYRNGKCGVLKVKKCEGKSCCFFKTKVEAEEDQKKVFRRINSLDPATRKNIMDLYYGGKMNLLDEVEVD